MYRSDFEGNYQGRTYKTKVTDPRDDWSSQQVFMEQPKWEARLTKQLGEYQMLLCNTLWSSMESILWVVQSSLFLSYLLTISPLLKKLFSRFWSSFSSICWSYFFFYLSGIAGYSGDFDVISTITSVQHADLAFVTRIKQAEYLLARLIPLK